MKVWGQERDKRRKSIRKCLIILFAIFITFSLSCGSSFVQRRAINFVSPAFDDLMDNVMGLESIDVVEKGIPGLAVIVSAIVEFSPDNAKLLGLAALCYTAVGLLNEDENPEFAKKVYPVGAQYGVRAILASNKNIRKGVEKGQHIFQLEQHLKKKDVPAAFWYCVSNACGIMLDMTDTDALCELANILEVMEKVYELDCSFFHHMPVLMNGAIEAMMGPLIGKGQEFAKKEFERVFKENDNGFLLANLFYAKFYATTFMLEDVFDEQIEYIINYDIQKKPDMKLFNAIAKKKVAYLKAEKNDYF